MNDYLLKNGKLMYRVKEGETLLSIAKKFSLTSRIIARENSLVKEVEKGELLFIPIIKGRVIEAKPDGDYLGSNVLAKNYLSDIYPFCPLFIEE